MTTQAPANYQVEIKESRQFASRYVVPVFMQTAGSGEVGHGTGILLQLRERRFVITCHHVTGEAAGGQVFFGGSLRKWNFQRGKIHRGSHIFPHIDLACYLMPDSYQPAGKEFINPDADCCLHDLSQGSRVFVYGYPTGRKDLQAGRQLAGVHQLRFTSTTYISVVENKLLSGRLGIRQPSIRWIQREMLGAKTFEALPTSKLRPFVGQGFSGGPVFTTPGRKLAGYVTDTDVGNDKFLLYMEIGKALAALDKKI